MARCQMAVCLISAVVSNQYSHVTIVTSPVRYHVLTVPRLIQTEESYFGNRQTPISTNNIKLQYQIYCCKQYTQVTVKFYLPLETCLYSSYLLATQVALSICCEAYKIPGGNLKSFISFAWVRYKKSHYFR